MLLTPTKAVLDLRRPKQDTPVQAGQKTILSRSDNGNGLRKTLLTTGAGIVQIKLIGANADAVIAGQHELSGKSNYFVGNDPKKWHTNVRLFARVYYENVYPGVNLIYYGNQRELEFDFILHPGASPRAIRLEIDGAKRLRLDHGDLVLTSSGTIIHLKAPHIYQERNKVREEVRGRYVIRRKNEVGFALAAYDRERTLVIDPVLAYSTYLGGNGDPSIALDSAGNAYFTGISNSQDVIVTKLNRDGTALIYTTYFGGTAAEGGSAIAVDSAGNAYIAGITDSPDFPVINAIQPQFGGAGTDAFVTKINPAGSALVYSTYLGGSNYDWGLSIAVGAGGGAYVTGMTNSSDFPTLNAIQPNYLGNSFDYAAFVTKIGSAGKLIYSTYLGGSKENEGHGIAVDSSGNAYVTGFTNSTDFPTVNAIQPTFAGGFTCPDTCGDPFVTKINASGTALVYSTYLGGGNKDSGHSIAVDSIGNTYVTGTTVSTDFPMVNAIQPTYGGNQDTFVTKFNASGNALVYSTYLGGSGGDSSGGIAVNSAGSVYVTGTTNSADFPTLNAIQPTKWGVDNAFVTEIDGYGTGLVYSTYLGGPQHTSGYSVVVDKQNSAYVTGTTGSQYFPTTLLALQPKLKSFPDGFVTKIVPQTFVSISPLKRYLPTKLLGASVTREVIAMNQGSGTLKINKIYIAGFDPGDFAETNTCDSALAAGASCSISIMFTPTEKNLRRAVLAISDSDPASPQAVPMSGSGTVVSVSNFTRSFGDEPVSRTSAPQNVTVTNFGTAALNFSGITITGTNPNDFSQTNTCGISIAAGANCTITVTFTPSAIGNRHAVVTISDDGGASPQKVILTGTGT